MFVQHIDVLRRVANRSVAATCGFIAAAATCLADAHYGKLIPYFAAKYPESCLNWAEFSALS